jgi:hypothetical protein
MVVAMLFVNLLRFVVMQIGLKMCVMIAKNKD